MPQLDIGIFFIEIFLNFVTFWFFYFFLLKSIFPKINFSIKIRKNKIKILSLGFLKFKNKFQKITNLNFIHNFYFLQELFLFQKEYKNILSILLIKNIYLNLFLDLNKKEVKKNLNNFLSFNFILN